MDDATRRQLAHVVGDAAGESCDRGDEAVELGGEGADELALGVGVAATGAAGGCGVVAAIRSRNRGSPIAR
jgi:hypothetical protein